MSKKRKQRKRKQPSPQAPSAQPSESKSKSSPARWLLLGIFSGIAGVVITYLVVYSTPLSDLDDVDSAVAMLRKTLGNRWRGSL